MFPCMILPSVCKTTAKIFLYSDDIENDGSRKILWSGTAKGNFQMSLIEDASGNTLTQIRNGSFLTPASYIPFNNKYLGGYLTINGARYEITTIVPNFDLYGKLNYWDLKVI